MSGSSRFLMGRTKGGDCIGGKRFKRSMQGVPRTLYSIRPAGPSQVLKLNK